MLDFLLADAGIPMLIVQLPLMIAALLPVVAVESLVARRRLELPATTTLKGIALANLASTFVGIPLAWLVMVAVNIVVSGGRAHGLNSTGGAIMSVVVQASWLIPYESSLYWMIPVASLVLLAPAFLASVLVERYVLRRVWTDVSPDRIHVTAWMMNAASYSGLAVANVGWIALALWR